MEQDWLYGQHCIMGGLHKETIDKTFNTNPNVIYCKKCGEYLFTTQRTKGDKG